METQVILFIVAGLLIAILVGASIWSARREKSRVFSNTFSTRPPSTPINTELHSDVPPTLAPQPFNAQSNTTNQTVNEPFTPIDRQEIENSVKNIQIRLPSQQPDAYPQEPQPAFSTQPMQTAEPTPTQAVESTPAFADPTPTVQLEQPESVAPQANSEPVAEEPQMVTLYVVAPEGMQFRGDTIQQSLDALGFQFGEYNIFHRHIDNASSPVLFSVANMLQPGVFDLNKMDQFTTVGLVFFMHLPSAGNDLVNVRLMIKTVESFAQSLGGFVLNDQHQLFDDESRQAYLLRVTQQ